MQKRFGTLALLSILTLALWVYWSSNLELKKTIIILKTNENRYIKDLMISPSNTSCRTKPFVILIVTSYVGHVELRSAHRRAMPQEFLHSMNVTRIFLLAKIPPPEKFITQAAIENESETFGDILQGSFLENYRNLTFKHLMGLQWTAKQCSDASYILKVDDDTVFNLERTYKLLKSKKPEGDFLMGYMLNNTKPRRDKQNKWYVSWSEYSRNDYPPYLSGWYYITTPYVAAKLINEAIFHPYFWIDDILITGLLTEALNIKLIQLPEGYWLEYYELLECCLRDMINKNIICDAVVGPNGGRNNLILEFNESLSLCNKSSNCTARNEEQALNKVCVAYRERSIFSDGKPEVQFLRLRCFTGDLELEKTIVLNCSEYRFLRDLTITPSDKLCRTKPFVIMLVASDVGHVDIRRALRNAMPRKLLETMNTTRIFLLGSIPPHEKVITRDLIEEENNKFEDILQGSFIENYRKLTNKHLMGLQWVSKECSDASYILKVDDDIVFSLERITRLLARNKIEGDFLMGYMQNNTKAKRDKRNKWYVSRAEYSRDYYPQYLSGWYYITTPKVAVRLTNEAMHHPYFWIDDILITGLLPEALNIKVIQLPEEFWFEYTANCVFHISKLGLLGIQ